MKRFWILLGAIILLLQSVPARSESLFDEKKKDAASSLKVETDKDRPVLVDENRRYIQTTDDYLTAKWLSYDDRMEELEKRMDDLGKEVAKLKKPKQADI